MAVAESAVADTDPLLLLYREAEAEPVVDTDAEPLALPQGEAEAEPVVDTDAEPLALPEGLAEGVQDGCCTHCPTPLQYQQGAHVALELHVEAQVSVVVWQA